MLKHLKLKYLFINLILIIVFSLVSSHNVLANNFIEDFNTTYSNPTQWEQNNNGGNVVFNADKITLSSSNPDGFPYIKLLNGIFPNNDFQLEWKFKYLGNNYNYGTGIIISNNQPPANRTIHGNTLLDDAMFATWVSPNHTIYVTTSLCEQNDSNCTEGTRVVHESTQAEFTQDNIIKVIYENEKYKYYFNDQLIFTSKETTSTPNFIWLGNPLNPATPLLWPSLEIDYIHLYTRLGVNLMTQIDPDWTDDYYDSAQDWTAAYNSETGSKSDGKMHWWGCSTTSAAMILDYYGVKLPDGSDINPGTLNTWLKTPGNNGYIVSKDGGDLSWAAVANLSKISYEAQKSNPSYHGKVLTLNPQTTITHEQIVDYLDQGNPLILHNIGLWGSYGHFFVAEGYNTTPADLTNNVPYSNLYLADPMNKHPEISKEISVDQARIYLPASNPDQSQQTIAEILITNPDVSFSITDQNNKSTGIDASGNTFSEIPNSNIMPVYYDQQVSDNVGLKKNNFFVKTANAASDQRGNEIIITDYQPQTLTINITNQYDTPQTGDLLVNVINSDNSSNQLPDQELNIPANTTRSFILNLTDDQNNNINPVEEPVTLESIKEFINQSYDQGLIYKLGLKQTLLKRLQTTQHLIDKKGGIWTKIFISHIIILTNHLTPKFIDQSTGDQIVQMLETFRDNL